MARNRASIYPDEVEWYLERLEGVEGGEGQWQAWCPCHDDVGTEWKGLGITEKGNKVLIRCYSCGAQLPEVYEAIKDEDPEEVAVRVTVRKRAESNGHVEEEGEGPVVIHGGSGMAWWVSKTGVAEDVWASMGCVAEDNGVAFHFEGHEGVRKRRRPPKEIDWVGTDAATAPPLWPFPGDELPEHIAITEGESDAGTAQAGGLAEQCFAATKGSKGALPPGWAEALVARGVRKLTVVGDTDEGGIQFRDRISREAVAAGVAVDIVRLETVLDPFSGINDLNGVWLACDTIDQFTEVVGRATQSIAARMMFKTVAEMEEIAHQEIDWLIPDLIAPGDKIILAAPQKSMKSFIALELTRSLVTGRAFLKRADWKPRRTFKVGYVQEEGAPSLWARRVYMLRISDNENALFSHRTGFRFTESSFVDETISAARDNDLDMIIFDPLQRMTPGLDENSNSEVGVVWDEVFRIQQALPHLVVMIVHHANRSGSMEWNAIRGASRHGGEVDLGIFLEKHPTEDHKLRMNLDGRDIPEYLGPGELIEISYTVDRDERIIEFDGTEVTINIHSPMQAQGNANKNKVFASVCNGADTRKLIMEQTGLSENTVKEHLQDLAEEGQIVIIDQGKGKIKRYVTKEHDETSE